MSAEGDMPIAAKQDPAFERLQQVVSELPPVAIAVSGGVDSLTLATVVGRVLGADGMLALHAVSPAVPAEATARTRELAQREGWTLELIDAGEFSDARYRANPADRCFFCKSHLYAAIRERSGRQILSGTNTDDLGEYRPGLEAARTYGVRHPYVEAGIGKALIRALARRLELGDIAELPAAPCLSSRVETGIEITPDALAFVEAVEQAVRASTLQPLTVRCRVRANAVVIELDPESLARVGADSAEQLREQVVSCACDSLRQRPLQFSQYRSGSAFLRNKRS